MRWWARRRCVPWLGVTRAVCGNRSFTDELCEAPAGAVGLLCGVRLCGVLCTVILALDRKDRYQLSRGRRANDCLSAVESQTVSRGRTQTEVCGLLDGRCLDDRSLQNHRVLPPFPSSPKSHRSVRLSSFWTWAVIFFSFFCCQPIFSAHVPFRRADSSPPAAPVRLSKLRTKHNGFPSRVSRAG